MPRSSLNSSLMKPLVALALPGMYLVYKYNQYKRQRQEQNRRKVTEKELAHLNHKIDKLLAKLDEHEPELAASQEEECVICITARATMQTFPCGHRVVCRKCFVKTIQTAVAQRMLPLRCVICRAKILRLKHSSTGGDGDGDSLVGLSPSPSTGSALSTAFSTCSSSFSLKTYASADTDACRSSLRSRRSCKSAPPSLHRDRRNGEDSSHKKKKSTAIAMAATVAAAPALIHLAQNNDPEPIAETKPPPIVTTITIPSRVGKPSRKLPSLPRATVRSRSPHKLQPIPLRSAQRRLEIIKEVVEEGDGRRRLTPLL